MKRPALLIIRTSALGDVAMTIPAIYSVARQYPQMDIKVLTRSGFAPLFINRPDNVSLIPADLKGRHKGIKGFFRLINTLRKEKIDQVADFHNILRSLLIDLYFFLCGKRVCIVHKNRLGRNRLTRLRNKDLTPQRSFILRYMDVLNRLGLHVTEDFTSLFSDGPKPILPDDLPAKGTEKWIGIAPFARYYNKTYPIDRMKKVVKLLSDSGYRIFLFGGGQKETEILAAWEASYPKVHALPGKLTLPQEISLMSCLDVMVSMDSANMHIASLAGTAVVSIWGSTTPACGFLGWGQKEANALYRRLPCQPCTIAGSPKCMLGHFNCMNQIEPEDVYRLIRKNIAHI